PGEKDVVLGEPLANEGDVSRARVVIDAVRVRHVDLSCAPNRIVRPDDANAAAGLDATLDEVVTVAGQRLVLRVRDLAGQPESAGRVAVRTGVSLDGDAVEDRVLGIVDPVLLRETLAADPEVHAPDRDVAEPAGRSPDFERGLLAHLPDEHGKRHGADEHAIGDRPPVDEAQRMRRRGDGGDLRPELETALEVWEEAIH